MKDFKSQYYIENIPWQRNLDYNTIQKFDTKYSDVIVFHYDLLYSILKISTKVKGYDKKIFVAVINACLRYYQIIKKLYPYNKVRVIIHVRKNITVTLNYDALKSILDIIPNFALCDDIKPRFNLYNYKHIIYGSCENLSSRLNIADSQQWSVMKGNLIIK